MQASEQASHRHAVALWSAQNVAEMRNGGDFIHDLVPDEIVRSKPAIDLIGHDSVGPICLEHTLIEAYEGQVNDNRRASEVSTLLGRRFSAGLEKPGSYTLALNTGDLSSLPRRMVGDTVESLDKWIRSQSLPVPSHPPLIEPNHVATELGQLPIRVTLFRMPGTPDDDGRLRIVFGRDRTIEEKRRSRIRKALLDKAPKLEDARSDGAITVLALESNDYVLSNSSEIARILHATAPTVEVPIPDVIIIVDTSPGVGSWSSSSVKFGDWWSDAAVYRPPDDFLLF